MTPLEYITLYLQPTSEPTLTEGELDSLVELAQRIDSSGYTPDDPAWTPTYDYASAIAQGWVIKAGKCAGAYQFKQEGQEFHREQMIEHCLKMASEWKSKQGIQSVPLTRTGNNSMIFTL